MSAGPGKIQEGLGAPTGKAGLSPALFLTGLVFILDRFSKSLVRIFFHPDESHPLWAPWLYLTYHENRGAAFGLFPQGTVEITVFSIFLILVLGILLWRYRKEVPTARGLGLILGGALGNLWDRLRWGYVIDFIDLKVWPIFNLADSAITIGCLWILCHLLWKRLLNAFWDQVPATKRWRAGQRQEKTR